MLIYIWVRHRMWHEKATHSYRARSFISALTLTALLPSCDVLIVFVYSEYSPVYVWAYLCCATRLFVIFLDNEQIALEAIHKTTSRNVLSHSFSLSLWPKCLKQSGTRTSNMLWATHSDLWREYKVTLCKVRTSYIYMFDWAVGVVATLGDRSDIRASEFRAFCSVCRCRQY